MSYVLVDQDGQAQDFCTNAGLEAMRKIACAELIALLDTGEATKAQQSAILKNQPKHVLTAHLEKTFAAFKGDVILSNGVVDDDEDDDAEDPELFEIMQIAQRMFAEWEESKHPRVPAGSGRESGRFAPAGGAARGGEEVRTPDSIGAVNKMRAIFAAMEGKSRQEILAEIARQGLNVKTASSQLWSWNKQKAPTPTPPDNPGLAPPSIGASKKEVQAWFKQRTGVALSYHGNSDRMRQLAIATAQEHARIMETFNLRITKSLTFGPTLHGGLRKIEIAKKKDGTNNSLGTYYSRQRLIRLDPVNLNIHPVPVRLDLGVRAWTVTGNDLAGTYAHELGHAAHAAVEKRHTALVRVAAKKGKAPPLSWTNVSTMALSDTPPINRTGFGAGLDFTNPTAKEKTMREVSRYATTNSKELFAESFAAFVHPDYGKRQIGQSGGITAPVLLPPAIHNYLTVNLPRRKGK